MNDLAISTSSTASDPVHFLNVEYLFRILYDLLTGSSLSGVFDAATLAHLWNWISFFGYAISIAAIGVITFAVIELYKLREREKAQYAPVLIVADDSARHARWRHIESMMESPNPSDWRQAIIEADIYLGDILRREGYPGETIGDMLKAIEPSDLDTLNDAWEAHKVRNEIAHQGSAFALSESLARRTIARYENVFRELQAV